MCPIAHAVQLVNEFVLPSTIDAAVFNDLLKAFEDFRPYTVGAMDGAAARGRLDIVQRLHVERIEGCSSAALIGAASNGHLELTEATKHGHLGIIRFLRASTHLREFDRERLLVMAAANGHVAIVRVFLRGVVDAHGAVAAAAGNGHGAWKKALEGGHIGTIELLTKAAGDVAIELAFTKMAAVITKNNDKELVPVLLEKCPSMETPGRNLVWGSYRFTNPIQSAVATAMSEAADAGQLDMLRVLTKTSASYVRDILSHAVNNDQRDVQKLLLELCEAKYLQEHRMASYMTTMLEQAAAYDDLETVQQIFAKCGRADVGDALWIAVENNSVKVVSLLVKKSEPCSVVAALVEAATRGKADMVQALLDHSGHQAIESALERTVASGNVELSTMLLRRCNPSAHKRIFQNAASSGCAGVLQLLLDEMEPHCIHRALFCAAARGHVEAVAELLEKSESSAIACALECAATEGRLSVVKVLRSHCDAATIRNAMSKAQLIGDDEIVHLLSSKKVRFE
ncbi:hypothetical protein PHYSODRAFT_332108 [Phytophthora sojae]|uniref:Uncharacterized protein n=1 Tax=Phytophthora sojae (strain P6497) TaxID=1094619 RepID=G4ZJR3_PHYSP|nr:hypothetical protein PHYSODRAFT_332108 [Phytophthora sojae]EGZ18283.1 hypothetical protein PHYSODRAFT_332108 [Phytophthora sojae]|eukprot:XP_009527341.1 hypothetical protein PHYSODRAFT_332108 [Phytophthora sojae]